MQIGDNQPPVLFGKPSTKAGSLVITRHHSKNHPKVEPSESKNGDSYEGSSRAVSRVSSWDTDTAEKKYDTTIDKYFAAKARDPNSRETKRLAETIKKENKRRYS